MSRPRRGRFGLVIGAPALYISLPLAVLWLVVVLVLHRRRTLR